MNTYMFSPSLSAFFEKVFVGTGHYSEEPNDLIDIPDEVAYTYQQTPPVGYWRGTDNNNLPTWVLLPPPDEQSIEQINREKYSSEYNYATGMIGLLTDATDPLVMGDDILPEDVELLQAWKKYRVELSRMTDFINPMWPNKPNA